NWVLSPFLWLWPFLLMVSLLVFPAYVIYSRIMGSALSLPGRRWFPLLLTISSFLVIQAFLLCVYSLFGEIVGAPMNGFFALTTKHLLREGWWTIVNMALAMAIFHIRKADDEKDMLIEMRKDNTYFKLRYLRAQLNPHFLFNTLNSIYSLS